MLAAAGPAAAAHRDGDVIACSSASRSRCGWATSGRCGFLAINISNFGRAVPTFAVLVILWRATGGAGPACSAPPRSRGRGDPDRAGAVRAAADGHQRLRRGERGALRRARGRGRDGDGGGCSSAASSCRWPCPWWFGGPARAGAGLGDRHDRGAGGRARPGPRHHRGLLQHRVRQGHGRGPRGRRRRAGARAPRRGRPARRRPAAARRRTGERARVGGHCRWTKPPTPGG